VVEPDGARSPSRSGNTGLLGYVGKSTVAVVAVEDALAILRDVEIGETVAVVVAHGNALPISASGDAGLLGHVRESTVAIVVVKRVTERRIRGVEVAGAAVDEVEVHPAIVIVVEERAAGAGGLGEIFLCGLAGRVFPRDAALRGGDFFEGILRCGK